MYIDGMLIANFRGYAENTLKFGRYNQIRGANGSGKSTILYAIDWAIRGECRITQKGGRKAEHLVREGQHEANVVVQFDGKQVQRSKPRKGEGALLWSESESTKPSDNQPRIEDAIGANAETIAALLDPTPFLLRKDDEQYAILLRVLRPPAIEVTTTMKRWGINAINGVAHLDELIDKYKVLHLRDANREQKALGAKDLTKPVWPREGLKEHQILAGHKKAMEIREQLTTEHGGLLAEIKLKEAELEAPEPEFSILPDEEAKDLEQQVRSIQQQIKDFAQAQKVIDEKRQPFTDELAKLTATKQEKASHAARLKGEIERMKDPVDCTAAECPVIASYKARFAEQRAKVEADLADTEKAFLKAGRDAEKLQKKIDALDAETKQLTEQQKDLLPLKSELEKKLAQHQIQAAARAKFYDGRPSKEQLAVDLETLKAQCAEVEKKLATAKGIETKAQQAIAELAQYNHAIQEINDIAIKIRDNFEKIRDLKKLLSEMEKIRQDIVESKIGRFVGLMNEFLQPFSMKVAYDWDDGFRINERPLEMFSHSETTMFFEGAFRYAVAKVTEIDVIVLEHEAPTDLEHHALLVERLLKSGCQVFQVYATHEARKPPAKPGVKFFWCSVDPVGISHAEEILAEAA